MQEIKIPEGCKASIDFEKRVVVIESEKVVPNRGDIVYCEYYDFGGSSWVAIADTYSSSCNGLNIADLIIKSNSGNWLKLRYGDKQTARLDICRLATPSEAQLLFDALAKEGKRWNATTLQIEDIEKDILVPESIGIYRCREDFGDDGDGLYIAFNNNIQLLYYNSKYKVWYTIPLHSWYERVQCKLTPCKREDLKIGDTAVIYQSCITKPNLDVVNRYYKVLPDNKYAKVNAESVSVVTIEGRYLFYKVETINK